MPAIKRYTDSANITFKISFHPPAAFTTVTCVAPDKVSLTPGGSKRVTVANDTITLNQGEPDDVGDPASFFFSIEDSNNQDKFIPIGIAFSPADNGIFPATEIGTDSNKGFAFNDHYVRKIQDFDFVLFFQNQKGYLGFIDPTIHHDVIRHRKIVPKKPGSKR